MDSRVTIPYTITVDTEEEWDWTSGFTTESRTVSNIDGIARFQSTCEAFGAKVTYFVNYAVLVSKRSSEIIRELDRNPMAEIGLHYHPWNTPPFSKIGRISTEESFLANLPWEVAKEKLDTLFEQFDKLGIQPKSFRGGRYSTSEQIQKYLFERGIVADCSVVPYTRWNDLGAPDYTKRNHDVIRKRTGLHGDGFWEVPLTRGFTRGNWDWMANLFNYLERSPLRYLRLIGIFEKTQIVKRIWLNLEQTSASDNCRFLQVVKARKLSAINFTLHSSSLGVGFSPYVVSEMDLARFYADLHLVLTQISNDPTFEPVTVYQLVKLLEQAYPCES